MVAAALLLLQLLGGWPSALAADDFLPPEQAFHISVQRADGDHAEVQVHIAPGYYLYRDSLRFTATGATLGLPEIPQGERKFDPYFRKQVETFRGELRIRLPVSKAAGGFALRVVSQGCADAGLCYPPMTSSLQVGPR